MSNNFQIEKISFFASYFDAISDLDDADRLALYDAVFNYAFLGIEIELNGLAKTLFKLIKPNIDSSIGKVLGGAKKEKMEEKKADKKEESYLENKSEATLSEKNKLPCKKIVSDKEKDKEEEKDIKEILPNGSIKKSSRFSPPTLEEVRAYCAEKGYNIDVEHFIAHYTANGWTQGRGKPIKDWRACVVTWAKNDAKFNYANSPPKTQTVEDFDLPNVTRY